MTQIDETGILTVSAQEPADAVSAAVADPITTEVIRQTLISATRQMQYTLRRSAFSVLMTESLDFACALFDPHLRLMAAERGPVFVFAMSAGLRAAIEAVGEVEEGDVLLTNYSYHTGTHANDMLLGLPVFVDGELVAWSVIQAHQADVGGKHPLSTDTIDIFQEGTIFPGVKLRRAGKIVDDVYRTVLANSRAAADVAGDLAAQMAALDAGADIVARLVRRYGGEQFHASLARMYDHGEAFVRKAIAEARDGRYVVQGAMDSNGVSDERVPFTVVVEVHGDELTIDYTQDTPPEQPGPINSPLPCTVSSTIAGVVALAGADSGMHFGHSRPIHVKVREGTLFHPRPPAPAGLYGWVMLQSMDLIHRAMDEALPPGRIPAGAAGDIAATVWWGVKNGRLWFMVEDHPGGQGGMAEADATTPTFHVLVQGMKAFPAEVWEARTAVSVERYEFAIDSCGAGEHRGGPGVDVRYRVLEDCWITPIPERTKTAPWGLHGGLDGRRNAMVVTFPDGSTRELGKETALLLPAGTVVEVKMGGGGGYGPPERRPAEAVAADLREGLISEAYAREHFPHAFEEVAPA